MNPRILLPLTMLAGWMNRNQQRVIEYLQEENRVLRELHGNRRLKFTDRQRARLARKGKALGWTSLQQAATLVTPQTILRWHRKLSVLKKGTRAKCFVYDDCDHEDTTGTDPQVQPGISIPP